MVDPNLNTNLSVCGVCFCKTIIDICSQSVQRNVSFAVLLISGDFRTTQSSGAQNLDTLCVGFHGSLDCLLHGSSEGNSSLQSLCNALCSQLCVQLGSANFFDGDFYGLAGHLNDGLLQLFNAISCSADYHSRSCSQDNNSYLVCCRSLNNNACNACCVESLLYIISDLLVFNQEVREIVLSCIPLGVPILVNSDSQTVWINFLTHLANLLLPSVLHLLCFLKSQQCGWFSSESWMLFPEHRL